jgi:hypothetical protein
MKAILTGSEDHEIVRLSVFRQADVKLVVFQFQVRCERLHDLEHLVH